MVDQGYTNPVEMEKFANEHAPGLFDALLATISDGKDVSKKRKETQKTRTVAVLHQLSYFRNQVRKNIDIYHVYLNKRSTVTFWCGTFLTELKSFDKLSCSCRVQCFLVFYCGTYLGALLIQVNTVLYCLDKKGSDC